MLRLLACLLSICGPVFGQSVVETAEAASARLLAAASALEQAQGARDRVSALTETVHAYEDGLTAMRAGLRQAAIRERTLIAQLDAKSVEVSRLLAALQSIERAPAPLLLLHPDGPLGTARSGMMAADVTPALQSEVEQLRAQLSEVAILRTLQDRAVGTLQDGLNGAQEARTALSQAIADRTDLPKKFVTNTEQMNLLISSSDTLESFATGLAETAASEDLQSMEPSGDLPLPVRGRLLRAAGAPDAAGVSRPGVIIATRPRALVTAPAPSTVLYAGPLLNYGNVVILEPALDLMFIVAGLSEVFTAQGDVIEQGAPLGLLGGNTPLVDDILTQSDDLTTGIATETLYLEVRDGQTPVDPSAWFALE